MTSVRGFTSISEDAFAVCGDYLEDENASDLVSAKYTPAIARMNTDGEVRLYWSMTGDNAFVGNIQDRCMGLAYNPETATIAVMI